MKFLFFIAFFSMFSLNAHGTDCQAARQNARASCPQGDRTCFQSVIPSECQGQMGGGVNSAQLEQFAGSACGQAMIDLCPGIDFSHFESLSACRSANAVALSSVCVPPEGSYRDHSARRAAQ